MRFSAALIVAFVPLLLSITVSAYARFDDELRVRDSADFEDLWARDPNGDDIWTRGLESASHVADADSFALCARAGDKLHKDMLDSKHLEKEKQRIEKGMQSVKDVTMRGKAKGSEIPITKNEAVKGSQELANMARKGDYLKELRGYKDEVNAHVAKNKDKFGRGRKTKKLDKAAKELLHTQGKSIAQALAVAKKERKENVRKGKAPAQLARRARIRPEDLGPSELNHYTKGLENSRASKKEVTIGGKAEGSKIAFTKDDATLNSKWMVDEIASGERLRDAKEVRAAQRAEIARLKKAGDGRRAKELEEAARRNHRARGKLIAQATAITRKANANKEKAPVLRRRQGTVRPWKLDPNEMDRRIQVTKDSLESKKEVTVKGKAEGSKVDWTRKEAITDSHDIVSDMDDGTRLKDAEALRGAQRKVIASLKAEGDERAAKEYDKKAKHLLRAEGRENSQAIAILRKESARKEVKAPETNRGAQKKNAASRADKKGKATKTEKGAQRK